MSVCVWGWGDNNEVSLDYNWHVVMGTPKTVLLSITKSSMDDKKFGREMTHVETICPCVSL